MNFTRKGFLGFGGAFLATGGLDAGAAEIVGFGNWRNS